MNLLSKFHSASLSATVALLFPLASVVAANAAVDANPYKPQEQDRVALRAAVVAETPAERAAALARVSDRCPAAVTVVDFFKSQGLIGGEADAVVERIEDSYRQTVRKWNSEEMVQVVRFPAIPSGQDFAPHPLVGVYETAGFVLQVVELPAGAFFINRLPERFSSASPELIALGLFESSDHGRAEFGGHQVEIDGEQLRYTDPTGKTYHLRRTVFENPALGIQAPEGAELLVDKQGDPVGATTKWDTIDGALEVTRGGATKSRTKATGSIRLHLEFCVPSGPAFLDQKRGNSGLFIGPYEIQINDAFGFDRGANQCGGIYFFTEPKVNAALPPAQWQAYDVTFHPDVWDESGSELLRNARITVHQNGVLIHDDYDLSYPDPKRQAEKKVMVLFGMNLQEHRSRVRFRNFWWVPIK